MQFFSIIKAILLRYFYVWRSDYNTMLCSLYWPLLDILLWGFLGSWIQSSNSNFANYQFIALLSILLWQVVGRGSNIMINAFNEELWSNNIVNLFSLPLKIIHYIGALIFHYLIMVLFTNIFCISAITLFFNISFLLMLKSFILFFIPFLFCGLALGFLALSIIVLLGKRASEAAYILTWFLLPFSGAYYPIDILPSWGVAFSKYFPMSYLFATVREYFVNNVFLKSQFLYGSIMALFYLVAAIVIFIYCFDQSKKKGLARLTE